MCRFDYLSNLVSLQSLFSMRDCKTVVECGGSLFLILLLADRLCEEKTRSSSSFSVAGVGVETYSCVGTFLT